MNTQSITARLRMSKYTVVPYIISGVKLYAAENLGGYIEKYCDTKERAQEVCDKINHS